MSLVATEESEMSGGHRRTNSEPLNAPPVGHPTSGDHTLTNWWSGSRGMGRGGSNLYHLKLGKFYELLWGA